MGPIAAFDVNAACTGGAVGLLTAMSLLAAGAFQRILLVAADTTTRHLHADDANTRILFGDGAAGIAAGKRRAARHSAALVGGRVGRSGAGMFHIPAGETSVSMQGRELFRLATEKGAAALREACSLAGLTAADVDCVLVHQANLRIVTRLQERTGSAAEKWLVNIGQLGNTAAPSVLLTLADLLQGGTPAYGTRVLVGAFGAGLTWCTAALEWGVPAYEYASAGHGWTGVPAPSLQPAVMSAWAS